MKPQPFISIVIPAYNEGKSIHIPLESLKEQDYQGKFEVIVVDNNSTDNTAKVAKRYGAKVIVEPEKGAAHARQAGFMASSGEIIATTDSDTILPEDWLSRIAYEFQKHPEAVVISGLFNFYDGTRALNFWNRTINYPMFVIFGWYSGANMAVKRDAFNKVGGFRTFFPLAEDSDLGVRLRKFGKVYRFNSFRVKTSARRFNQLGFWLALWDYCYNYVKFKLYLRFNLDYKSRQGSFKSGSEIHELGLLPKIAIQAIVIITILGAFLGGIFEIKPVRAQVIRREQYLRHQLSKIDIDMPNLPHVNSFHHVSR